MHKHHHHRRSQSYKQSLSLQRLFTPQRLFQLRYSPHRLYQPQRLIDFALVLAGYPTNKDYSVQIAGARAILKVPVPVDIIQYQDDSFCSPACYPYWAQELQATHGTNTRYRLMDGDHDDAKAHFADTNLGM